MSVKCPAIAAAAAIIGLTRWVRPPRPWRPSKLRLLVDAHRSPGCRMSGFIPRHMEHPDSRHSKPASRKIWSQAFLLGCMLDRLRTRDYHRPHFWVHLMSLRDSRGGTQIFNSRVRARSDEHSIHGDLLHRAFQVASPCKTGPAPRHGGRTPARACRIRNAPVTGTTIPGFVPQVTNGASDAASISMTRSNFPPGRSRGSAMLTQRCPKLFPWARNGEPGRRQVSSRRARSFPRVLPLRCSCCRASCGLPSKVRAQLHRRTRSHTGGAVGADLADDPQREIFCRDTVGQRGRCTSICIVCGLFCGRHCVARTCSTSTGADAEGQRAKGAMGTACGCRHIQSSCPAEYAQFRPDYVHNALLGRIDIEQAERQTRRQFSVESQSACCDRIGDRQTAIGSRYIMVGRRHRFRAGRRTRRPLVRRPSNACRRGNFMNQVQININKRRLSFRRTHQMGGVPRSSQIACAGP